MTQETTTETADQRTARIVAWLEDHDPQLADAIEREFTPLESAAEPPVDPLVEPLDRFLSDKGDASISERFRTALPDMIRAAPELIPNDVKRGIAAELTRHWEGWESPNETASKLWPDEGDGK